MAKLNIEWSDLRWWGKILAAPFVLAILLLSATIFVLAVPVIGVYLIGGRKDASGKIAL